MKFRNVEIREKLKTKFWRNPMETCENVVRRNESEVEIRRLKVTLSAVEEAIRSLSDIHQRIFNGLSAGWWRLCNYGSGTAEAMFKTPLNSSCEREFYSSFKPFETRRDRLGFFCKAVLIFWSWFLKSARTRNLSAVPSSGNSCIPGRFERSSRVQWFSLQERRQLWRRRADFTKFSRRWRGRTVPESSVNLSFDPSRKKRGSSLTRVTVIPPLSTRTWAIFALKNWNLLMFNFLQTVVIRIRHRNGHVETKKKVAAN